MVEQVIFNKTDAVKGNGVCFFRDINMDINRKEERKEAFFMKASLRAQLLWKLGWKIEEIRKAFRKMAS